MYSNFVKGPTPDTVIGYNGTSFDDPNWEAATIPRGLSDGVSYTDYDSLPSYDDPGQPWGPKSAESAVNDQFLRTMATPVGSLIRALDDALPDVNVTEVFHHALRDVHTPPAWDSGVDYKFGDICSHQGVIYMALQDVAHAPPDDVYDIDTATGGWMPVNLEV